MWKSVLWAIGTPAMWPPLLLCLMLYYNTKNFEICSTTGNTTLSSMKLTEIPEIRTNQQMNAIQTLGIIWNQPETNDKKFLGLSLTTTNYLKNRPTTHHAKTENLL